MKKDIVRENFFIRKYKLVISCICLIILAVAFLWYPPFWQKNFSQNTSVFIAQEKDEISLSEASLEDLQLLKGIGEKRAIAIIEYREKNGSFKTWDDVQNIKGIGKKRILELHAVEGLVLY